MAVSAPQTEAVARACLRELARHLLHFGIVEVEDGRGSEVGGARGRIGGGVHCGLEDNRRMVKGRNISRSDHRRHNFGGASDGAEVLLYGSQYRGRAWDCADLPMTINALIRRVDYLRVARRE